MAENNGVGNVEQQEAPIGGVDLSWLPLAQGELVLLELWRLRREMQSDPAATKLSIGAGNPAEQTIPGDRRDPFNGVVIFNPTPATLSIGFEAGLGYLAPATVPPFTWANFPERYANLSVALLNPNDQAQTINAPVTILRLRVPPPPGAGPYGQSAALQPLQSIPPGSSTVGMGAVLDNGYPRQQHTMVIATTAGVSAGAVGLQGSHDAINWFQLGSKTGLGANNVYSVTAASSVRYVAASITTAVSGGTVGVTVASA